MSTIPEMAAIASPVSVIEVPPTLKVTGIEKTCECLQIAHEDTYAFGDSMNDYDMIHYVQHGIVMGNGLDEVKAVADYVTSDLHKDGIYNGLHHFGLI